METSLTQTNKLQLFKIVKVILFLLSFLLWIDALTGMIEFYLGISIKLSLLYKLPLIAVMIVIVGLRNRLVLSAILAVIIVLLVGPIVRFSDSPKTSFLINDISLAIKFVTPFIAFYFCKIVAELFPETFNKFIVKALFINFFAVLFNLFIGALGFGYPSYGGADGEAGIGVNGFYVAGNELSGCYVLLFGFVLHFLWNYKKFFYVPFATITLICGALIATKTAILSSLILVFFIPIFNEKKNIFRLTKLKVKVFLPLLIVAIGIVIYIIDLLIAIGLYDKVVWVIQEKGIWGLILSGRVEFSAEIINAFMRTAQTFEFIFGIGTVGMSDYFTTKYSAEVDPVDMFVYVGVLGSAAIYFLTVLMIAPAFTVFKSALYYPPVIVLVNLILLMLCVLSGHILNSGMLGILWGMFNSLIFIQVANHKKTT